MCRWQIRRISHYFVNRLPSLAACVLQVEIAVLKSLVNLFAQVSGNDVVKIQLCLFRFPST